MPETVGPTPPSTSLPSRPLSFWGWDEVFEKAYQERSEAGDLAGRLLRADRGAGLVALDGREARLPVQAQLRAAGAAQPTTGDWVLVRAGEIVEVLPRRTAVVRASTDRDRSPQILAANVELVLVVEPLGERWRPRHLERLLVVAWQSGALPVVVLTKADRCDDVEEALQSAAALAPGVSVHAVSSLTSLGVAELSTELTAGTTAVIVGRSGAGKSTLTNLLSGGEADLATAEVREDGKGRHTTVTRELVPLSNGALLIDTPGIRAIGLTDSPEALADAFSEIEELAASCRFSDCAHESEPGCAVTAAIEEGSLTPERLESYGRLQREQLRLAAKEDPRLRAARTAEWRAFSRQLRQQPRG